MGEIFVNLDGNLENAVYHINEAVSLSQKAELLVEELLASDLLVRSVSERSHPGLLSQRMRAVPELLEKLSETVPKRYWRQFQLREDIYSIMKREGRS